MQKCGGSENLLKDCACVFQKGSASLRYQIPLGNASLWSSDMNGKGDKKDVRCQVSLYRDIVVYYGNLLAN